MPRKYVGLIGIGGMYVWACALMFWIPEAKSFDFGVRAFGYAAMALVTASMAAFFLYANSKAEECERLREQLGALKAALHPK